MKRPGWLSSAWGQLRCVTRVSRPPSPTQIKVHVIYTTRKTPWWRGSELKCCEWCSQQKKAVPFYTLHNARILETRRVSQMSPADYIRYTIRKSITTCDTREYVQDVPWWLQPPPKTKPRAQKDLENETKKRRQGQLDTIHKTHLTWRKQKRIT